MPNPGNKQVAPTKSYIGIKDIKYDPAKGIMCERPFEIIDVLADPDGNNIIYRVGLPAFDGEGGLAEVKGKLANSMAKLQLIRDLAEKAEREDGVVGSLDIRSILES